MSVAFDTTGAVLAPRRNGSITGLWPWTWPELPEHARTEIKAMGFGRYTDVPRDLLAALLEAR